MHKLAIIIPVYKSDFLKSTLESIASQTCKNFNVYIGNDDSPFDIDSIVNSYKDRINVTYKKFSKNLGGNDLVAQWERCISMTSDEDWLWLFSDDDTMDKECVSSFYRFLEQNPFYNIYHFNVNIINSENLIIERSNSYPDVIYAENFFRLKSIGKIRSFVVENIFSRKRYQEIGGVKNFEMAWESDTATWILMSKDSGMKTISGAYVNWRQSDQNITPNRSKKMSIIKLTTDIEFFYWVDNYFRSHLMHLFIYYAIFRNIIFYSPNIKKKEMEKILNKFKSLWGCWFAKLYAQIILFMYPLIIYYKDKK